ncbi:MAG: DUF167 domain-containing protein [Phycisphaerae bacterium]|nr:DUF167 domain-containing protein [Phycisphaerae bacterium]
MIELVLDGDAVLLPIKVVPGASKTRIIGELDSRLKVAVAAPPEKGKANDAVTALLAKHLGIRRRDVTVISGHTSPVKMICLAGVSIDQVRELIG